MARRTRYELWVDGERVWQRTIRGDRMVCSTILRGREEEALEHAAHVVEVREITEVCDATIASHE